MPCGFRTCGPNEAMVITGCCYSAPKIVCGGRVFLWSGIQKLQRLSLNVMTLIIESPRIYTQLGVPLTVTGVAQVKIQGGNLEMLYTACEQFLGKSEREVAAIAKETLEAHQRAIMGNMTVEEIYKDRKKFSKAVFEVASSDLVNMGISVVSYTLKDISDDEGYLKALGMTRIAQVKRDARIGEAEARQESGIKEALAEKERMESQLSNKIEIEKAERDFKLKKATYDQEVNAKKAQTDMAYDLQAAKTRQRIKEEEMQIKVVERTQQIQVQELEITRQERSLDSTVRKPAEAEKYRLEKIAEAQKMKLVKESIAESESIKLRGNAEAFAIEAKAQAEAEQMAKKAQAFEEYQEAARLDMILEALPRIAAECSAPLAKANKITMVSSGSSEIGCAKLTGEVMQMMDKLPKIIDSMTGVDIESKLKLAAQRT